MGSVGPRYNLRCCVNATKRHATRGLGCAKKSTRRRRCCAESECVGNGGNTVTPDGASLAFQKLVSQTRTVETLQRARLDAVSEDLEFSIVTLVLAVRKRCEFLDCLYYAQRTGNGTPKNLRKFFLCIGYVGFVAQISKCTHSLERRNPEAEPSSGYKAVLRFQDAAVYPEAVVTSK